MRPFLGVGPVRNRPTLVVVHARRQAARSGLKAYVRFPPSRSVHAAWFPAWWPRVGTHLVVSGHVWDDTNETHHQEVVFCDDRVHAVARVDVAQRWRRHQRRLDRKAGRVVRSS